MPTAPGVGWSLESVLWPVATYESSPDVMATDTGVIESTAGIVFGAYPSLLAPSALIGLGLVVLAGVVWLRDGCPGLGECWRLVRWPIAALRAVGTR
ncbi:hypothetical protein [Natronococcus roseus]|uniref:hypothetical protein n=1 Tax=Natronococcus roseus TaxID=1052014 RepID=UPI00374D08DF